jgi:chromosome segregation protein
VLAARDEIGGIVGPLASLIRVPPEYEAAIEAALGPLLQAIVVETWADAQRAIGWLRRQRAGRVTFLPAEVRGPRPQVQSPADLEGLANLRGLDFTPAAELVTCQERYRPLVERLLGDVIMVPDLSAAMRVLDSAPPGVWRVVTLDGVVVEAAGAITGGTTGTGRLAQERAWQELPQRIAQAKQRVGQLETEEAACQASCAELARHLAALEAQWRDQEQARSTARATLTGIEGEIEALERETAWREEIARRRAEELATLDAELARLETQAAEQEAAHTAAEGQAEALHHQLQALGMDNLQKEAAEAERQLALANREREALRERQAGLRTALAELEAQLAAQQQRREELNAEREELAGQIAARATEEASLAGQLEALEAELRPVEEAVQALRRRERQLADEATRARERLRQAEAALSEALLEVQRREDRLRALQEKIADDVELAALDPNLPRQLALQLEAEQPSLPPVVEIPEGLEQRIRELRRQIRRLGSASPELLAEYEATKERYDFLTGQAADLEEAAADLRRLAQELSETMAGRFDKTFKQVARAFSEYFTRLFDGGEARLRLVEPEDEKGEAGLEIMARPPGKRTQSLAMLSGGERALTAVALLFALLRASPTPFCVLDEVDAMLDDANIGRFRMVLEELAQDTQVIIITHNRGTIQAADTIYGITMGEAGVSQVLSLKPDEVSERYR